MPLKTQPMTPAQRVYAGPAAYSDPEAPREDATTRYGAGFVSEQDILSWEAEQEFVVNAEAVEGYDQYRDIPEDLLGVPLEYWDGVQSPAEMSGKVGSVRMQLDRAKTNESGGFAGVMGQITGFVSNPEVWATGGVAGLGMRGVSAVSRIAKGAAFGTGADILHEVAMHDVQDTRTKTQTGINIASAAVLTGLFSGAFGKTIARHATDATNKEIRENLINQGMRAVGSDSHYDYASERILNQPWITSGMLSPMRPLVASKSGESLHWTSNLWEHSYTLGKTVDGRAQQIAMETQVDQEIGIFMRANNTAINGGYKDYVGATSNLDLIKGVKKNWGRRSEFEENVHWAMINEDKYAGPSVLSKGEQEAVERTAQTLRSEIYDQTLAIAKEAELMNPEEFATKFAKSYAPRRWNKKAVIRDEIEVRESLREAYIKNRQQWDYEDAMLAAKESNEQIAKRRAALTKKRDTASANVARLEKELAKKRKAQAKTEWGVRLKDAKKALSQEEKKLAGFTDVEEPFSKTIDDFSDPGAMALQRVDDYVNDTFDRIAYGFDQDVYMGGVSKGLSSPFKARAVPLDDTFLLKNKWLESNMEAMTMSHINNILKPSRMKQAAGDVELEEVLGSIRRDYTTLRENAKAAAKEATDPKKKAKLTKEMRRLGKEEKNVLDMHKLMRDRWYGRKSIPNTRYGAAINDFLRSMRNLNTTLMMGMVLPTSLGDVARWNMATIYAPELGEAGPGIFKAMQTLKLNKEQWQAIGIAHEVATQIRTAKIIDGTDIIGSHAGYGLLDASVHGTSVAAKALIKATHLAEWTDFGKLMSASYVQNDLIQKMMGFSKLSARSKGTLARMGINEDFANSIQREVKRSLGKDEALQGINRVGMEDMGYKGAATVMNFDNWADQVAAKKFQQILFRESERSLVTPKTGDIPMFLGDSEFGRTIGQFTTFLFGAVQQIGVPVGKRLRYDMDPKAYRIAGQMVLGGMFSVAIRNSIQGPERFNKMKDWSAMDWALNGVDYSGTVPMQMYMFNGLNLLTKGGLARSMGASTMTRYATKPSAAWLGPTAGTIDNMIGVAQIPFSTEGWTEAEVRKMRRMMLFNNLMYFTAGAGELEKQALEGQ